jgi:hypothetical protein
MLYLLIFPKSKYSTQHLSSNILSKICPYRKGQNFRPTVESQQIYFDLCDFFELESTKLSECQATQSGE